MRMSPLFFPALALVGSLGFAACSEDAPTTSGSSSGGTGSTSSSSGMASSSSGMASSSGMGGGGQGGMNQGGMNQGGMGQGGMNQGGMNQGGMGQGGMGQGGMGQGGMNQGGMNQGGMNQGGMGQGGGPSVADCFNCSTTNCINEINACQFNATCQPWLQCVQLCSDSACTDMCDMQYPNAKPQYDPIYACNCNNCTTQCAMFNPCKTTNWQSCQSCTQAHCPNAVMACQNDALCAQWLTCMQSCNDEPCSMQCDMQYANAKPLFDPIYTCNCAACTADCSDFNSCGKVGSSPLDCSTCAQASCLQPLTACQFDALCSQWLTCVQACTDAACADMCDMQYANAKPLYDPVYACTCAQCSADCAVYNVCNL